MSKLGAKRSRPKIVVRYAAVENGKNMKVAAIVNGKEYATETVPHMEKDMYRAERRVKKAARDKLRGEGLW